MEIVNKAMISIYCSVSNSSEAEIMQSDLIPVNRDFRTMPIENSMLSTMFCLNAAGRTAAVERFTASCLAAKSCKRTFSLQNRYRCRHSARTTFTGQLPLSSRSEVRLTLPAIPLKALDWRRTYAANASQDTNTIQGTIGKGASGVAEEAQRVKERLQAPDHLNEKEKMIFEKLDGALEPTKLEVCDINLGLQKRDADGRGLKIVSSALMRAVLRSDMLTTRS